MNKELIKQLLESARQKQTIGDPTVLGFAEKPPFLGHFRYPQQVTGPNNVIIGKEADKIPSQSIGIDLSVGVPPKAKYPGEER